MQIVVFCNGGFPSKQDFCIVSSKIECWTLKFIICIPKDAWSHFWEISDRMIVGKCPKFLDNVSLMILFYIAWIEYFAWKW